MQKTVYPLIYITIIAIAIAVYFRIGMPYSKYLLYVSLSYLFIVEPIFKYMSKKKK